MEVPAHDIVAETRNGRDEQRHQLSRHQEEIQRLRRALSQRQRLDPGRHARIHQQSHVLGAPPFLEQSWRKDIISRRRCSFNDVS